MKKRLARIAPLKLGIVLAVLYALLSLLLVIPFGAISMLSGSALHANGANAAGASIFTGVFLFFMPVIYALLGFIGGVIAAAIYNLVAKFTGGIEVTVEDVA